MEYLKFQLTLYKQFPLSKKPNRTYKPKKRTKGQKRNISLKRRSLIVELAECTLDWTHNLLFNSIHLHLRSSKLAVASLNWQESCWTSWAETSQFPDFHRTPIKFSLRVFFVPSYIRKHMHLVLPPPPQNLMVFAKKNKTMPGLKFNAVLELTCPPWSAHDAIILADRRDLHSNLETIFSPAKRTELYFRHTSPTMPGNMCLSGYIHDKFLLGVGDYQNLIA